MRTFARCARMKHCRRDVTSAPDVQFELSSRIYILEKGTQLVLRLRGRACRMPVLRLRGRARGARVPPLWMTQIASRQSFDCVGRAFARRTSSQDDTGWLFYGDGLG